VSSIELTALSVSYGRNEVLHDVELTAERGGWVGIIGPNGAGKSTLLKAIAGLVEHVGDVRIDGHPTSELSRREIARRVAYVPQDPITPEGMSVFDYVLIGRTPYIPYLGVESRHDLVAADEVIHQLDLVDLADRPLGSLSGGEHQRAVLGRALAQGASILLLDEPTKALDVGRQAEVMELIGRLRSSRGLTVVGAMHDLTLAAQFADDLLLLRDGRVADRGSARDVITEGSVLTHYGARVRILEHPEGGVVVAPARPPGGRSER
jgi:iron complex transport system ATP-binding protein